MGKASLFIIISAFILIVVVPVRVSAVSTCQTKSQGDANCDGVVDLIDYYYYVQESHDIPIPPSVSADFNQDGKIDVNDKNTIVAQVRGLAQSVIRFSDRILSTIPKFRI